MNYVIIKDDGYYVRLQNNRITITTNVNKATSFTKDKAEAILNNQIKLNERHLYSVTEIKSGNDDNKPQEEDNELVYSPTMFDDVNFDWKIMCGNLQQLFSQLSQYRTNLQIKHKRVEAERIDLEHYIEFIHMNASQGYKAFKMLQDTLRRRRQIKDDMRVVNLLINSNIGNNSMGSVLSVINGLNNREYNPRVLKELFED